MFDAEGFCPPDIVDGFSLDIATEPCPLAEVPACVELLLSLGEEDVDASVPAAMLAPAIDTAAIATAIWRSFIWTSFHRLVCASVTSASFRSRVVGAANKTKSNRRAPLQPGVRCVETRVGRAISSKFPRHAHLPPDTTCNRYRLPRTPRFASSGIAGHADTVSCEDSIALRGLVRSCARLAR